MNRNSTRARDRRRFVVTAAGLLFAGAALGQDRVAVRSRRSGERIRVLGGVMEWRLTPAETGDTYFLMESVVGPGTGVPPPPSGAGRFYVLDGEVEYAAPAPPTPWNGCRQGPAIACTSPGTPGMDGATAGPAPPGSRSPVRRASATSLRRPASLRRGRGRRPADPRRHPAGLGGDGQVRPRIQTLTARRRSHASGYHLAWKPRLPLPSPTSSNSKSST